MINLSVVAELFHMDRGTDRMMNPTVAFRYFAKAPNKNKRDSPCTHKRDRPCTHKRNTEVVSRNRFCRGWKRSITYSDFVSLESVSQHSKRMCSTMLYCHVWPVWLPYFFHIWCSVFLRSMSPMEWKKDDLHETYIIFRIPVLVFTFVTKYEHFCNFRYRCSKDTFIKTYV